MTMRVDVFSTIHKALRRVLFELADELARVELSRTIAIDDVVARVERVIELLDEHALLEDECVFPMIRELDPLLADELAQDHRALLIVQCEVERIAQELAMADLASREHHAHRLAIAVTHLIALQLLHMNREETEGNRVLWSGLDDAALLAISKRAAARLSPDRAAEWQQLVIAATHDRSVARRAG